MSNSAIPWTAAYQAPPSMGFSRHEYWSGVPLPSPFESRDSEDFSDLSKFTFLLQYNSLPQMCSERGEGKRERRKRAVRKEGGRKQERRERRKEGGKEGKDRGRDEEIAYSCMFVCVTEYE